MMRKLTIMITLILVLLGVSLAQAQDEIPAPVITADNVAGLASAQQWDFADGFHEIVRASVNPDDPVPDEGPLRAGEFESGWFTVDNTASQFAIVTSSQDMWVINAEKEWIYQVLAPTGSDGMVAHMVDASFASNDFGMPLIATYSDGAIVYIKPEDGQIYGNPQIPYQFTTDLLPVSLWVDCPGETYYECVAWVELVDAEGKTTTLIQGLDLFTLWEEPMNEANVIAFDGIDRFEQQSYAPAADEDAYVRIGRIEPPHVVTSSPEGAVKLWNIQSGELMAEAQVENGPVVFGQINAAATHLAWRGPEGDTLNLLDFQTGENQVVAELDGAYAQFYLVSHDADVIFLVHVDDQPVVVAYDVATGERHDLGEFRQCNREPDMARLSADGTTLVIGCDTGLDIWQVLDTEPSN